MKRKKLAAGELGIDLYNMRPRLKEAGLEYINHIDELETYNNIAIKRDET